MSWQSQILEITRLLTPQRSQYRKIRLGSLGDGGYVLPDDLAGISRVLSIGIGSEVSFDIALAERGMRIFQYDPTVDHPPQMHPGFEFFKSAWSHQDGENEFTLATMLARHGMENDGDVLLKFDTEGAEWQAIPNTSQDVMKHFRIIACELHGLHNLHNQMFLQDVRNTLINLTRHHTVVHLHANNCCGMNLVEGVAVPAVVELTLLRNDRSDFSRCGDPIPGPLDYPSMPDRPDFVLRPFG